MLKTTSLGTYAFLCFIFGLTYSGTYSVGYVLYLELMPQSHQIFLGLLVDLCLAFCQIFIGLTLQYMSKDYRSLAGFSIMSGMTCTTINYFFVQESPKYLLEKGKRESAFLKIKKMASWNDKLGEFDFYIIRQDIKQEDDLEKI